MGGMLLETDHPTPAQTSRLRLRPPDSDYENRPKSVPSRDGHISSHTTQHYELEVSNITNVDNGSLCCKYFRHNIGDGFRVRNCS